MKAVWTGAENVAPTAGIRSPTVYPIAESLYRLSYLGPLTVQGWCLNGLRRKLGLTTPCRQSRIYASAVAASDHTATERDGGKLQYDNQQLCLHGYT